MVEKRETKAIRVPIQTYNVIAKEAEDKGVAVGAVVAAKFSEGHASFEEKVLEELGRICRLLQRQGGW